MLTRYKDKYLKCKGKVEDSKVLTKLKDESYYLTILYQKRNTVIWLSFMHDLRNLSNLDYNLFYIDTKILYVAIHVTVSDI